MFTPSVMSNKLTNTAKTYWQRFTPRDRTLILAASLLIGIAFCWWVLLSPAIKTIRTAPELHKNLDAQIQTIQGLSHEAKSLQGQAKLGADDVRQALQATVMQRFGSAAQLNVSGNRATLILKNATPQSVTEFLSQARINARTLPSDVKITRSIAPGTGWDGNMTLILHTK